MKKKPGSHTFGSDISETEPTRRVSRLSKYGRYLIAVVAVVTVAGCATQSGSRRLVTEAGDQDQTAQEQSAVALETEGVEVVESVERGSQESDGQGPIQVPSIAPPPAVVDPLPRSVTGSAEKRLPATAPTGKTAQERTETDNKNDSQKDVSGSSDRAEAADTEAADTEAADTESDTEGAKNADQSESAVEVNVAIEEPTSPVTQVRDMDVEEQLRKSFQHLTSQDRSAQDGEDAKTPASKTPSEPSSDGPIFSALPVPSAEDLLAVEIDSDPCAYRANCDPNDPYSGPQVEPTAVPVITDIDEHIPEPEGECVLGGPECEGTNETAFDGKLLLSVGDPAEVEIYDPDSPECETQWWLRGCKPPLAPADSIPKRKPQGPEVNTVTSSEIIISDATLAALLEPGDNERSPEPAADSGSAPGSGSGSGSGSAAGSGESAPADS